MDQRFRAEIEQLYMEMFSMLFEYASSVLPNSSLAEEAVQETFQIACQRPQALCESPNPKGWLVNTLKNVVSNTVRSRATAERVLNRYAATQVDRLTASEASVGIEMLYDEITVLEEFKLLKEMAVDGRSYHEMAQSRGISMEACRKRVQRAKEVLRKKYENDVTF